MKVAFATLGCKVNQYDTATIETALLDEGHRVVPFRDAADVYVINTCTVTDRADAESRQLARRARRCNPGARVVMTGCFAQTRPQDAALPEVDHVIGIGRLADLLRAVRGELDGERDRIRVSDLRRAVDVSTLGAQVFVGQTRAFLKVQEGCDLFCTFCIVPFARGRSRSVEPRRVLLELERLAERGFREVVLTGIHLGSYGHDLTPQIDVTDLLEMIAEVAPIPRVRLSSIDPPEVTPRLLDVMRRSPAVCPHLHMPVQSGADPVLRRMRRQYDRALVADVVAEIGRVLPGGGLGTDVIAGFPGETEQDHDATCTLLAQMPFTYLHVFPYSRRTGTTAAKASDPHSPETIRARAAELRVIDERKRGEMARRQVGAPLDVLVESTRDRQTAYLTGYARSYVRVLMPGPDAWMGREVRVHGVAVRGGRVEARPSDSEGDHAEARPG